MFWIYLGIMFMTAMGGVALGLVISSLVADPKTAANIVPLVLIPQIIMGGALIKYEDMNRNLALVYTLHAGSPNIRATDQEQEDGQQAGGAIRLSIHRHALVRTKRLVVAQAKLNPLTRRQDRRQQRNSKARAQSEQRLRSASVWTT